MGKPNFSDEFKRDAVAQITERGYPVAEVSQRLGVSPHSLYAWKRQFAKVVSGDDGSPACRAAPTVRHSSPPCLRRHSPLDARFRPAHAGRFFCATRAERGRRSWRA